VSYKPLRLKTLAHDTILRMPYKNPEDQRRAARAHYEANKETYVQRALVHNQANRAKAQEVIRTTKAKPCADCGVEYPYYVMQFDHLSDKEFTIGSFKNVSIKKLLAEIAKCEVVCANCHAERTHARSQFVAAAGIEPAKCKGYEPSGLPLAYTASDS
jgi:hypothetical protein